MKRNNEWLRIASVYAVLILVAALPALAQSQVFEVTVHSPGLEHNLLGDSADQRVGVYLPAAYRTQPQRHFATIYFLHGFADTPAKRVAEIIQTYMDKLIASGQIKPMIVVAPNGLNRYFGSFYVNSTVTGNWEDYVVHDVVGYMDTHFRTIAAAESRGISGHSMGGYGSLMLAFRHPDVFSSVYAMSPCCTVLDADLGPSNPEWSRVGDIKSADELQSLLKQHFLLVVFVAMDAAFAPDPDALPMRGHPAFRREAEQIVPDPVVLAKFQKNIVSIAIPELLPAIHKLKAIYIDYGEEDEFSHIPGGARAVSAQLALSGVPHILEAYAGNHGDHVRERVETRVLPWFSQQLKH